MSMLAELKTKQAQYFDDVSVKRTKYELQAETVPASSQLLMVTDNVTKSASQP